MSEGGEPTQKDFRQGERHATEAFRGRKQANIERGKDAFRMLRRIFVYTLIILVVGGGIALGIYYWFFVREPPEPEEHPMAHLQPEGPAIYVQVPPVKVPILHNGDVATTINVDLRIQPAAPEYESAFANNTPTIHDVAHQALFGYLNEAWQPDDQQLDLEAMRAAVQDALAERFGDRGLASVKIVGLEQNAADPRER